MSKKLDINSEDQVFLVAGLRKTIDDSCLSLQSLFPEKWPMSQEKEIDLDGKNLLKALRNYVKHINKHIAKHERLLELKTSIERLK